MGVSKWKAGVLLSDHIWSSGGRFYNDVGVASIGLFYKVDSQYFVWNSLVSVADVEGQLSLRYCQSDVTVSDGGQCFFLYLYVDKECFELAVFGDVSDGFFSVLEFAADNQTDADCKGVDGDGRDEWNHHYFCFEF